MRARPRFRRRSDRQSICGDFKTGKVLRIIPTSPNRQFYGHGTYSTDGKILYSSETITVDDYEGVIIMRDADTMDVTGEFPSYGARPHDCQLLSDGRTMIITNGGGLTGEAEKGSVTYVDVLTHKLIKKLSIENKRLNAGHVAYSDNGDIAVVSAPREGLDFAKEVGGISVGGVNNMLRGGIASRKILDNLLGEMLSVCIDNAHRLVAATSPDANCVTFWDLDTAKLKHVIKIKHPRGITMSHDKRFFILNYDNPEFKIGMINSESLEPVEGFDLELAITGSHIVNYHF